MGSFGDGELFHIDFMRRLLLVGLGLFISLDQILAEMFKIDICTDYYQFVKWIETFFPCWGSSALLQNRLNEGRVPTSGWQTVG